MIGPPTLMDGRRSVGCLTTYPNATPPSTARLARGAELFNIGAPYLLDSRMTAKELRR